MGGACSTYGGKGEVYTGFWWGNLTERDNLGDPGTDGRKWYVGVWAGSRWLKIDTSGRHL